MELTVWLDKEKVALYIGGDPKKGEAPLVTIDLKSPQILVDKEKGTIIIVETQ